MLKKLGLCIALALGMVSAQSTSKLKGKTIYLHRQFVDGGHANGFLALKTLLQANASVYGYKLEVSDNPLTQEQFNTVFGRLYKGDGTKPANPIDVMIFSQGEGDWNVTGNPFVGGADVRMQQINAHVRGGGGLIITHAAAGREISRSGWLFGAKLMTDWFEDEYYASAAVSGNGGHFSSGTAGTVTFDEETLPSHDSSQYFVRNVMLLLCELLYVASVVALIAWLGHTDAWIPRALPQLAVLPLAPIALGNLSSVLVPTPFMRLNRRFQAPGTWVRWAVYVAIPLMLSTYSLALYWLPSRVEHHFEPKVLKRVAALKHLTITQSSATHVYVAIWLVVIPLWQLAVWLFALRLADALARMRRHGLARLMDRHVELAGGLPPLSLYQSVRALPVRFREIPTDLRAELKLIRSELLEASTTLSRL